MKLIISRKGMDSGAGGIPSPVSSDGSFCSLPIPDPTSSVSYSDITTTLGNAGTLIEDLSAGRLRRHLGAHLDPDLSPESLCRLPGWKPMFGQFGSAQSHLKNAGIAIGDLFLFFGWFRLPQAYRDLHFPDRVGLDVHVLFGWLQIAEIVDPQRDELRKWMLYHPHAGLKARPNNTIYVASDTLVLGGKNSEYSGAGVFSRINEELILTASSSRNRSVWALPKWFYPSGTRTPLTFHSDLTRWRQESGVTYLESVGRGQEFCLDLVQYPEAFPWISSLLNSNN